MDWMQPVFFPVTAMLIIPHYSDESISDSFVAHPLPWSCLIVYLATSVWAGVSAYRLKFREYPLAGAADAPNALFGCLLFWPYGFASFLNNRFMVRNFMKTGMFETRRTGRPSGKAWPTALIWAIAWAIIMSAAIPGIMPSRLRLNQHAATASLLAYAEAQKKYVAEGNASFCAVARELHYGTDSRNRRRGYLPEKLANAIADTPENDRPHAESAMYRGYVYFIDPFVATNGLWNTEFGLFAFPASPGRTGYMLFWTGREGLYAHGLPNTASPEEWIVPENSPLHPNPGIKWGRIR